MTSGDILLERETANDEEAVVVAVHVSSGATVEPDQLLFEIENSKAVQELRAPTAGVLVHALGVGETVPFGAPIARIVPASAEPRPHAADPTTALGEPKPGADEFAPSGAAGRGLAEGREPLPDDRAQDGASGSPAAGTAEPLRISRAAAALMRAQGVPSDRFGAGFVTTRRIHAALSPPRLAAADGGARPPGRRGAGRAVTQTKRREIEVLSAGAGATMLSVLGVDLGPLEVARTPGAFLSDRITDLVIYEASRLMRKFPNLNSAYADGEIYSHEHVHAGLAIDGGGRLVVYGIEHSDRVALSELEPIIVDALARYGSGGLTAAELSRATFTVTDLSATPLDFVSPILPRDQGCIIGVTRSGSGFKLFAGFDHRVTEGAEVASFLEDLRQRVVSFTAPSSGAARPLACDFCGRTLGEVVDKGRDRGLLKVLDRRGVETLCCASCWNGW